jgi:hypothetical protein
VQDGWQLYQRLAEGLEYAVLESNARRRNGQ